MWGAEHCSSPAVCTGTMLVSTVCTLHCIHLCLCVVHACVWYGIRVTMCAVLLSPTTCMCMCMIITGKTTSANTTIELRNILYQHMCVCTCTCMYMYMYVCIYVCMCVGLFVVHVVCVCVICCASSAICVWCETLIREVEPMNMCTCI